jgi:hypothetical protein
MVTLENLVYPVGLDEPELLQVVKGSANSAHGTRQRPPLAAQAPPCRRAELLRRADRRGSCPLVAGGVELKDAHSVAQADVFLARLFTRDA